MVRHVILDTETTGLNRKRNGEDVCSGHRIIEIGCVEIVNGYITGNSFHSYVQPNQPIDPQAIKIHGITDEFLKGKPLFSEITKELIAFIKDATIVIHNAPFDISFLDKEFRKLPRSKQPKACFVVVDTLDIARNTFPGQKNTLDALCERYSIAKRQRNHGALIDAEILSKIYLAMNIK